MEALALPHLLPSSGTMGTVRQTKGSAHHPGPSERTDHYILPFHKLLSFCSQKLLGIQMEGCGGEGRDLYWSGLAGGPPPPRALGQDFPQPFRGPPPRSPRRHTLHPVSCPGMWENRLLAPGRLTCAPCPGGQLAQAPATTIWAYGIMLRPETNKSLPPFDIH